MPEVAPGGDGTRFCGECRVASAGRGGCGARAAGCSAPWGHARRRVIAMAKGLEEFWPRRGRCRSCGRTHVLLPAVLWSRRRYGAAVIMAVLVLAVQAAGRAGSAARPWLAVPGRAGADGAGVDGPVVAVAVRRSHAAGLREQLTRLLPLASGAEAARPAVPSGSPAGDCLAVLEAVTAGLRGRFRSWPRCRRMRWPRTCPAACGWRPGAGPGVQHDPVSRGRRVAFVIMPAGAWSGYPVMNRAFSRRQT